MISEWISVALVIVGIIAFSTYMVFYKDNGYKESLNNPEWPPKCNADVEARINDLIKAIYNLDRSVTILEGRAHTFAHDIATIKSDLKLKRDKE